MKNRKEPPEMVNRFRVYNKTYGRWMNGYIGDNNDYFFSGFAESNSSLKILTQCDLSTFECDKFDAIFDEGLKDKIREVKFDFKVEKERKKSLERALRFITDEMAKQNRK